MDDKESIRKKQMEQNKKIENVAKDVSGYLNQKIKDTENNEKVKSAKNTMDDISNGDKAQTAKKVINEGKSLNNSINQKWSSMGKGGKIITFVLICCVACFLIGVLGTVIFPDANTTTTVNNVADVVDNRTDAQKNTTPEIYVTPDNSSFSFFGTETLAANSGYEMCINVGDECYYLGYTPEMNLVDYSHNVAAIYNASAAVEYQNDQPVYQGDIGYVFPIRIYDTQNQGSGDVQFDFDNDMNFSFTYHTGTVGANSEAKIVDNVYDANGNQL